MKIRHVSLVVFITAAVFSAQWMMPVLQVQSHNNVSERTRLAWQMASKFQMFRKVDSVVQWKRDAPARVTHCKSHVMAHARYAVVSMLSYDGWHVLWYNMAAMYISNACKLARSIQRKAPEADLILLLVDSNGRMSASDMHALESEHWQICRVDAVDSSQPVWIGSGRYDTNKVFSKLHTWALVEYEAVVFLDADILVVNSFDRLFTHELWQLNQWNIGWVSDYDNTPSPYNTGVLILRPNIMQFLYLMGNRSIIQSNPHYGEQNYLIAYFEHNMHLLDERFNIRVGAQLNDSNADQYLHAVFMHYILKPWKQTDCENEHAVVLCAMWLLL